MTPSQARAGNTTLEMSIKDLSLASFGKLMEPYESIYVGPYALMYWPSYLWSPLYIPYITHMISTYTLTDPCWPLFCAATHLESTEAIDFVSQGLLDARSEIADRVKRPNSANRHSSMDSFSLVLAFINSCQKDPVLEHVLQHVMVKSISTRQARIYKRVQTCKSTPQQLFKSSAVPALKENQKKLECPTK